MKASLEAAGVKDIASARAAAAQRKEHLRRSSDISKEMANLAPGNQSKQLAAGLDALKGHLGELRGRLKREMEDSELKEIPGEDDLARDIASNHQEGARLPSATRSRLRELRKPFPSLSRRQAENHHSFRLKWEILY